ncbi:MAG: TlpA disulfide reductase family protein [Desulfobulbaceae bacterium]|nr:TlpA disulfide reductase family protein [Desulfobulbaceae bacterium]
MIKSESKLFRVLQLFSSGFLFLVLTGSGAEAVGRMPDFSLTSAIDGKQVTSDEYQGQALLITFFATWCPPCRQEIPSLIKLQEKYVAEGFSVIGISMDEKGPKVVAKLIEKENINYPILMSDRKTERDFGGIIGIPTSFLFDRQGNMVKRYPGYAPYSMLEKDIKSIL